MNSKLKDSLATFKGNDLKEFATLLGVNLATVKAWQSGTLEPSNELQPSVIKVLDKLTKKQEAALLKKNPKKYVVICQAWEESERGWGRRPDGFTMHLTKEDCTAYVAEYNKKYNNEPTVPDCYTVDCGSPYMILVDSVTYNKIKKSKNGIWGDGNYAPERASADEIAGLVNK